MKNQQSLIKTRLLNLPIGIFVFIALIVSFTGCSSEHDIELSIETNHSGASLIFDIQAIADEVVIDNVVINRGNCRLGMFTVREIEKTVTLKFGKIYRGYGSCSLDEVKEIEVSTKKGTFTFLF